MNLSKNSQYVSSEGDRWYTRLLFDDLGFKEDGKPEFKIKSDEKIKFAIDSDFFDLIDNITNEFNLFVRNELIESECVSHYLSTHEPFSNIIKDIEGKNTVIKTLALKDICKIFIKLNHSINIDTFEGKILFLYQLKDINIIPDFNTFNNHCYALSQDSKIIKVRVAIDDLIKCAYNMNLNLEELDTNDFYFKRILDQIDKELSKKYMVLLYRFASVVAKADGKITKEEEDWLSRLLAMTEADKDGDKAQPNSHISQGGSNPIEELESLIGLASVKKDVVSLANFIKMKKMREDKG